jgi:AGCS family alanine or glycine:cation symporter
MFGKNEKAGKIASIVYSVIAVGFIFLGSLFPNDLVWELTDMFNNLMVIPNVLALFALSAVVVGATKFKKEKKLEDQLD